MVYFNLKWAACTDPNRDLIQKMTMSFVPQQLTAPEVRQMANLSGRISMMPNGVYLILREPVCIIQIIIGQQRKYMRNMPWLTSNQLNGKWVAA